MTSFFENKIQILNLLLSVFITVVISFGCNQKEREKKKVDEYKKIFTGGNYRKVLDNYEKLLYELSDTTEIARANDIFHQSKNIVEKVDSLLSIANNYNNNGFNLIALKYAEEAKNLYPNDSLCNATIFKIPKEKNPKFTISGTFGSATFNYVFHTVWNKEKLKPVSVDITVTNLHPYSPTVLAYFVPSFYYLEVSRTGGRVLVVVADHYKWNANKQFSKPIYYNKSLTGTVSYAGSNIIRRNTNMTLEKLFEEIIIGEDERFYLNMVGVTDSRFSGLAFDGYE